MTVQDLVKDVPDCRIEGNAQRPITHLVADHRQVGPDDAFIAIRGARFNGHSVLAEAIERGARTLIVDEAAHHDSDVTWVRVPDTRQALAGLAANFYGRPFETLTLVGITGTNGKTSTAHLIQHLLSAHGLPCARLGTVGHEIGGQTLDAENTTPDALELNRLLRMALDAGKAAAMEVSSHALCTHRVEGVMFDAAVWTNLTQDHLDFHETMEAYLEAKLRLFRQLKRNGLAVLNADDPADAAFVAVAHERSDVRVLSFGLNPKADVRAVDVKASPMGTYFTLLYANVRLPISLALLGDYNVSNALAALGVGVGMGLSPETLKEGIESLKRVPGRFEPVNEGQPFAVVVDYAHTPDALERLLHAARELRPHRVIAVFGCGGDRDRTKRPIMGGIAARLADVVVVTSDNPRTEDPFDILRQVEAGIPAGVAYTTIPLREEAIAHAIALAESEDMVVIAGKGHEDYQIIGTTKHHFDDREIARKYLQRRRERELSAR